MVDLNGRLAALTCLKGGHREQTVKSHRPLCARCSGDIKPDAVFFCENVSKGRLADTPTEVNQGDALVILGSSLTVKSGYRSVNCTRDQNMASGRVPGAIERVCPIRQCESLQGYTVSAGTGITTFSCDACALIDT